MLLTLLGRSCCLRHLGNFHYLILFLPPANQVWGKVMFLHMSVILFTWGVGSTWAGTPQAGNPQAGTPLAGTPPSRYTPSRYTALAGTPPFQVHPPAMHARIRSTSWRHASYWNAFLLDDVFPLTLGFHRMISGIRTSHNSAILPEGYQI